MCMHQCMCLLRFFVFLNAALEVIEPYSTKLFQIFGRGPDMKMVIHNGGGSSLYNAGQNCELNQTCDIFTFEFTTK